MATVYKGNVIGSSKKEGLFSKLSDEGTDLKKLKFKDFLNDVSRAPYVEHDINTGEPVERDSWWKLYVNTSELAVQRRLEDVKRLSKFIASPKGILWESERAALETIQKNLQQKQSKKIEKIRGEEDERQGFWKKALKTAANLGKSILEDVGLTAATLEQAGVSGTGARVNTYISRAYLLNGKESNSLLAFLANSGLVNDNNLNGAAGIVGGNQTFRDISGSYRSGLDFNPDPNKLMVSEDDKRLSESRGQSRILYGYIPTENGNASFSSNQLANQATSIKNYRGENIVAPSSSIPFNLKGASAAMESSIVQQEVHSSIRTSDSRSLGSRYGNYKELSSISASLTSEDGIYISTNRANFESNVATEKAKFFDDDDNHYVKNDSLEGKLGPKSTISNHYVTYSLDSLKYDPSSSVAEDLGLIPFCITTITPDHRTYLNFPAYLDSYDDNYTGEWESVKYVGRPENFYGYKGFTRSISLGFKVVAFNERELIPLYRELNRLVGATAPSYQNTLFMRGTLASLTIGDLLQDQMGFIPSIKLSWDKNDPWEIHKSEELKRVPHVLSVSMTFTPIEKQHVREDYGAYFVFDPPEIRGKQTDIPESSINSNLSESSTVDTAKEWVGREAGSGPKAEPVTAKSKAIEQMQQQAAIFQQARTPFNVRWNRPQEEVEPGYLTNY